MIGDLAEQLWWMRGRKCDWSGFGRKWMQSKRQLFQKFPCKVLLPVLASRTPTTWHLFLHSHEPESKFGTSERLVSYSGEVRNRNLGEASDLVWEDAGFRVMRPGFESHSRLTSCVTPSLSKLRLPCLRKWRE